MPKPFLVTIDTEGDDLWSRPRDITCRNARFLPRFQALCERYGLKPTYLTNYEMARDPAFAEFARDALRRGAAEVGMHLHAWHSPPHHPLTPDDHACAPYLIEFPLPVMRAKVRVMTDLLEETFGRKMVSHRAGRWALDARYARLLDEAGYGVDCSVTPHVDWGAARGATRGGADYRHFPAEPYRIDLDRIDRPGDSGLLELPMSVRPRRFDPTARSRRRLPGLGRVLDRLAGLDWLRPNGRNRAAMVALARRLSAGDAAYAQFMLHSSELMPGGSPYFPDADDVERLFADMEALFDSLAGAYVGRTLAEYRASALPA